MSTERTEQHLTDTVFMVSPDQFGFNPETAVTNGFQTDLSQQGITDIEIRDAALEEFDQTANMLSKHDIDVVALPSRTDVMTPDAVFPNNWVSTHADGRLVLYPMLTPNRRKERQPEQLSAALIEHTGVSYPERFDMTSYEMEGRALEGTGSLVLDRGNNIAYAMESPRTDKEVFDAWCREMGFDGVFFHAYDKDSLPIYHTNVVMSVGDRFSVWCPESIKDAAERDQLQHSFDMTGKESVDISLDQLYNFCGNILQVRSVKGESKIVMSNTAYKSFEQGQKRQLEKYGEIVPVSIPTIETVGGGSARCMLAEVFRPE